LSDSDYGTIYRNDEEPVNLSPEQLEYLDRVIHKVRWRLLAVWIVLFTATTILLLALAHIQSTHNKERIADIQVSRISSCRQTYTKIRQLMRQSTLGRKLTTEQQQRFERLLDIIDPSQCGKQTKPKEGSGGQ